MSKKTEADKTEDNQKKSDRDAEAGIAGLGDKLYKIRNYLGLNLGEILVKINPDELNGDNRSRISEYENEEREPSLIEILNYTDLVGISIETLFDSRQKLPAEIADCPPNPRCRKRTAADNKKKTTGKKSKKKSPKTNKAAK